MKDNLAGSLEELDGAFETAAVKISDALTPAIRWMTDNITAAVNWFNNLDGTTQKVIITVAALTAGIALIGGPMLLLIGYIPQIVSGFNSIITVTSALGKAFTFLVTNPIGLILVAIAGIIAAGVLLYQHWDDVKKYARDTWDSISSFFNDTWNAIKQKASDIWNGVKSFFSDNFSAMKTQITDTWRSIKTFLTDTWTGLKNAVSAPFTTIRNTLSDVWNTITSNVESAWNSIGNTIKGAVNGVIGAINKFINGVNGIEISVPSVDIPLVGKVGGFTIGLPKIPNIPMLDTGTNYVASDGLAYIHKGEAVIPKAYNPAAGGAYGGGITINVNAAYVDREAVSRLATEINRELGRRVGGKR
jgi:phage-related minor tail protein